MDIPTTPYAPSLPPLKFLSRESCSACLTTSFEELAGATHLPGYTSKVRGTFRERLCEYRISNNEVGLCLPYKYPHEEASVILVAIGTFLGFFLLILSVPGVIGGIGLLKRREWARILLLILSGLQLINIPIGTLVGIYSICVPVQKETILLFNPIVPPTPEQSN